MKMKKNQLPPQNPPTPFPINNASFPTDLVTYYGIRGKNVTGMGNEPKETSFLSGHNI